MPQIQLMTHCLLDFKLRNGDEGLVINDYDWFQGGKEMIGTMDSNLWISNNEFTMMEFKEGEEPYFKMKMAFRFMVGNIDHVTDREIKNICISLAADKMQEVFDFSVSKELGSISIMPPNDSDIWR